MFKGSLFGYKKKQVDNAIKELLKNLEKHDQEHQAKLDMGKQHHEFLTSFLQFLQDQYQTAKLREEVNTKAGENLHRILNNLNEESQEKILQIRLEVEKSAQEAQDKIYHIEQEKKHIMEVLQSSMQEVGEAYNVVAVAKQSMEVNNI